MAEIFLQWDYSFCLSRARILCSKDRRAVKRISEFEKPCAEVESNPAMSVRRIEWN